jgi:hypothetical protein
VYTTSWVLLPDSAGTMQAKDVYLCEGALSACDKTEHFVGSGTVVIRDGLMRMDGNDSPRFRNRYKVVFRPSDPCATGCGEEERFKSDF